MDCFDYSTGQSCANFPKLLTNLSLLYTVNPDPQRPTCVWVNADFGGSQIQSFDVYTGGPCGQGDIRALASQFVVNKPACYPITYDSLQLVSPAPAPTPAERCSSQMGTATPYRGRPTARWTPAGRCDLSGLSLNTATGLPQFVVNLTGGGNPGQVVIKLTWTATYDPSCIGPGITVAQTPTTTATSLSRRRPGWAEDQRAGRHGGLRRRLAVRKPLGVGRRNGDLHRLLRQCLFGGGLLGERAVDRHGWEAARVGAGDA